MLSIKQALSVGYKATNKNTLFFVKLLFLNFLGIVAIVACVSLLASIFMQGLHAQALDFKTFVKILVLMPAPFKTLFLLGILFCVLLIFVSKDFLILGWYNVSLDFAKTGASSTAAIFPSMSLIIKYFIATFFYNALVMFPFFLTFFINIIVGSPVFSIILSLCSGAIYWYLSLRLSFYPYLLIENKAQAWNSLRQSFKQTQEVSFPLLKLSVIMMLTWSSLGLIAIGLTQPFMPEVIQAVVKVLTAFALVSMFMIYLTTLASLYNTSRELPL